MAVEPEVLGVDDGRTEEVLSAVSSETARKVLSEVGDEPATASEISKKLDTSIQNVHYHLKRLESAGLVGVEDSRRSPKGNQMKVYAASGSPVVVIPGKGGEGLELKALIKRFLASVGVLGVLSVGVEALTTRARDVAMEAPGTMEAPTPGPEVAHELGRAAPDAYSVSPGLAFFLGGLAVLVAASAWTHWRNTWP